MSCCTLSSQTRPHGHRKLGLLQRRLVCSHSQRGKAAPSVQAGESEKHKSYTAICQLPTAVTPEIVDVINNTKDLELHQQTPVRVSHRRADLVRLRTVYAMKCEPVPGSSHHMVLQLQTQVCLTAHMPCSGH